MQNETESATLLLDANGEPHLSGRQAVGIVLAAVIFAVVTNLGTSNLIQRLKMDIQAWDVDVAYITEVLFDVEPFAWPFVLAYGCCGMWLLCSKSIRLRDLILYVGIMVNTTTLWFAWTLLSVYFIRDRLC
ncbi:hypothetical protein AB1L30_21185 [Bremerella sp. JC817]|uniref:hypothetical protein n=1 Tax=Bremerella sp. JC817 TaxID=3231756 RepID=UPI00345A257F